MAEEVKKKADSLGPQSFTFSEYEFKDALRLLEDDGLIQLIGNKKQQTIRLIGLQYL
jgi:hypothetical protein